MPHYRQTDKRTLGKILYYIFIGVDRIYRPKEIIIDVIDRYKIHISYTQVLRAKNQTLNALRGLLEEFFSLLPKYSTTLSNRTLTQLHILRHEDNQFKFFFMVLECSIKTFREYCHLVICVDGAFLEGMYLGTLFIVVGKDKNKQIYSLAFGVGGKERWRRGPVYESFTLEHS